MRRITIGTVVAVACAWLAANLAMPANAGVHPHDRNGFMIGFGIGGGSVGLDNGNDREGSVMGNLRIGWALRQDLVLHYEGSGWSKTFDQGALGDVTWTFATNTAAVTYYPPGTGVFLRGGVGIGTASVEVERNDVRISSDESGMGLLLAGGYEWRLTRKFALAPQIEYSYQDLDVLGSSNIIGGSLGFNWYW